MISTTCAPAAFAKASRISGWQVKTSTWLVCERPTKDSAARRDRSGSKLTSASSTMTGSRSVCSPNSRIRPNRRAR